MRRGLVVGALAALASLGSAASAAAIQDPPHCDPMACPDPVAIVQETADEATDGPKECVDGAIRAIRYIVQGTPQPQECSLP